MWKPFVFLLAFSHLGSSLKDEDLVIRRLPTDPIHKDLPLDREHSVRVDSDENDFFVIRMPKQDSPLVMFISPCDVPIHWQLRIPNQFEPNLHPRADHFNHILHMRIPPLIEMPEEFRLILLAGEENEKRMEFFANAIEADFVILNMSAPRPTNVRIFATTDRKQLDRFYPLISPNASVQFYLNEDRVNLEWETPSFLNEPKTPKHRFCIVTSLKRPIFDLCGESEDVDSIHCVSQSQSHFTLSNLRANERHFVTVFLRNSISGGSSAFSPIQFISPQLKSKEPTDLHSKHSKVIKVPILDRHPIKIHEHPDVHRLHDAALMNHEVEANHFNKYLYRLPVSTPNLNKTALMIHSCDGNIRLDIRRNGILIRQSGDFVGIREFVISCSAADSIQIDVYTSQPKVNYWIWASARFDRTPFAQMPPDRTVQPTSTECNRLTLQWVRAEADDDVRYCVHQKETKVAEESPNDQCWAQMPVGRKALCFLQSDAEPVQKSLFDFGQPMEVVVDGLKPDTAYRLDVSAQRTNTKNAQPLPYRTLFIRTKASC